MDLKYIWVAEKFKIKLKWEYIFTIPSKILNYIQ